MLHPDDTAANFRNAPTRFHPTWTIAEAEATRLSKDFPGQRFCIGVVYEHYVSEIKTTAVPYG